METTKYIYADECINKLWYIPTMEIPQQQKRNTVIDKSRIIMLTTKDKKRTICIIPFVISI